jgi:hypothetical protein
MVPPQLTSRVGFINPGLTLINYDNFIFLNVHRTAANDCVEDAELSMFDLQEPW